MPVFSSAVRLAGSALLTIFVLAGCGQEPSAGPQAGGTMPPAPVGIVVVAPQATSLSSELPGRLEPTRIAEVRARVPGIVLQRAFQEGSEVKAGQVLFRIDPAPMRAALAAATANLQRAEASLALARTEVGRFEPLVKARAISQQEYDNAVARQKLAQADVAALRAARDQARLDLGYATVTAPIRGRIGRALVTEGALVGQGEPTPMATIQQIDPINVDFTQPAGELARLRKAFESGGVERVAGDAARVVLVLDDGSEYPLAGRLLFSDVTVDRSTGQVSLRARFPNPDRVLLPGMYVRVRLEQGIDRQALRVPSQAIQRASDGGAWVWVVGDGDLPAQRTIVAGTAVGNEIVVLQGLQAGDRVVVEGFQKIRPGAPVGPSPWQPPGAPAGADGAAATSRG